MPHSVFRILLFAALFGMIPWSGIAQENHENNHPENTIVSPQHHPWGTFQPGAWKIVHVVTETLNEQGQVVSDCSTETKTTLIDIDDACVTLEIRPRMEVAGKRFEPEPQTVRQGFHGELICPGLKQTAPVDGEVDVAGNKIPCRIQKLECNVANGKTVTTIYFSGAVAPYILKRESITTDAEGKSVLAETNVEVTALDAPLKFRNETRNGITMKTIHKNTSGTITTWADVLPEVPGGIVGNHSKELDPTGRLIRRSSMELVDYGTEPEPDRPNAPGRKRPGRNRGKPNPR